MMFHVTIFLLTEPKMSHPSFKRGILFHLLEYLRYHLLYKDFPDSLLTDLIIPTKSHVPGINF